MEFFDSVTNIGYLGWFTIGLLFVLLEMVVPGVYLIWFGCAAFGMGILVCLMSLTAIETIVIYALLSALFAGIGWYVYSKIIRKTKVSERYKYLNDMAGAYIGKVYNLSEDVRDGRSKAKIGDGFWIVEIDENLKKGDKIKITDVENGVILKAVPYSSKQK